MQKIKRVRHGILGIAFSAAGKAQGAMTPQEANDFINNILKDGYHAIQVTPLRSTQTESGDPAFVQNEYIFIEYEDDSVVEEVRRVGRPKKVAEEEPVAA